MRRRTIILIACVGGAGVAAFAVAATQGDDEPLTGETSDNAEAAALDHVGEGTVVETAVGDDGAAYEVEIELDDGRQFEVNLDEDFNVLNEELDDD